MKFTRDAQGREVADQEGAAALLNRDAKTVRERCTPIGTDGRSLLYDVAEVTAMDAATPRRNRRKRT